MSCILRIAGEALDVDGLLRQSDLPADTTWRKGEPRILKNKFHTDSGATFVVSEADLDDFAGQLDDATAYLASHGTTIAALASFAGVEEAYLDFAVALYEGYVSLTCYLPPTFVQAAGSAGIGTAISYYACSEDDE